MNVENLLQERAQELIELREQYLRRSFTTARADRERLEHAIARAYESIGAAAVPVIWLPSSLELYFAAACLFEDLMPQIFSPLRLFSPSARFENLLPGVDEESPGFRELFSLGPNIIRADEGRRAHELIRLAQIQEFGLARAGSGLGLSGVLVNMEPNHLINPAQRLCDEAEVLCGALADSLSVPILQEAARRLMAMPRHQRFRRMHLSALVHSPLSTAMTLAAYEAFTVLGIQISEKPLIWQEAMNAGGWWCPLPDVCLACDNPTVLHVDERFRLHSESERAVVFENQWGFWCLSGVRVTDKVIRNEFSVTEINNERNVELRRIMIQRFGLSEYIIQSGVREIDRDECGILYRKDFLDDEAMVVVQVLNSTPEPDGSTKSYFLRVPPEIVTAKRAVAWTFGMSAKEYGPKVQT